MAITKPPGPTGGMTVVNLALRDLMAGSVGAMAAGERAAAAEVSQPIQRFMLKLSDVDLTKFSPKCCTHWMALFDSWPSSRRFAGGVGTNSGCGCQGSTTRDAEFR